MFQETPDGSLNGGLFQKGNKMQKISAAQEIALGAIRGAICLVIIVASVVLALALLSGSADAHPLFTATKPVKPIPHLHHITQAPGAAAVRGQTAPGDDYFEFWIGGQHILNSFKIIENGKEKVPEEYTGAEKEQLVKDDKDIPKTEDTPGNPGHKSIVETVEQLKDTPTRTYNCHGKEFAGSGAVIHDDVSGEVDQEGKPIFKGGSVVQFILDEDYDIVKGKAKVGDVVIWKKNGKITHSATVTKVDGDGSVSEVNGKWGTAGKYTHKPKDVPNDYGSPDKVWRLKTKDNGTGDPPGFVGLFPFGIQEDGSELCSGDLLSVAFLTVGGILEFADVDSNSPTEATGSSRDYALPTAAATAGAVIVLAAGGGWYARRRWMR